MQPSTSLNTAKKASNRSRDALLKERSSVKSKGKAREENQGEPVEPQNFHSGDITSRKGQLRSHRTFGQDDGLLSLQPTNPQTSSPNQITDTRLDPALFQEADQAFSKAQLHASIAQGAPPQRDANATKRNRRQTLSEKATKRNAAKRQLGCVRSNCYSGRFSFTDARSATSDVTVQQLDPSGTYEASQLDSTTVLPSKRSKAYLQDRLYKRTKSLPVHSKPGQAQEPRPFLLFDPLLDKPKTQNARKEPTRAELETRLRHRTSAQRAFSKRAKTGLGPSLGFGSATSTAGKRKRAL